LVPNWFPAVKYVVLSKILELATMAACTAGLAGQRDARLRESEKLPLAPPAAIDYAASQDASTTPWTFVTSHPEASRAFMSMAHAALIAKREGLLNR